MVCSRLVALLSRDIDIPDNAYPGISVGEGSPPPLGWCCSKKLRKASGFAQSNPSIGGGGGGTIHIPQSRGMDCQRWTSGNRPESSPELSQDFPPWQQQHGEEITEIN